jgi:hypothetical protein
VRASRYLVLVIVPLLSTGCDSSVDPTLIRKIPPPPQLVGRYTGEWQVTVEDTMMTCGYGYCSVNALASPFCDLTIDIAMPSDRTYVARFAVDTASGCRSNSGTGETGILWRVPFMHFQTHWTAEGEYDPEGGSLRFVVGDGSAAALEALVGCALDTTVERWAFYMSGGDLPPDAWWRRRPESQSYVYASLGIWRYDCGVRDVVVNYYFWAER